MNELAQTERPDYRLALGLVVLVVVAYITALSNGYIWDDDHYVTGNATLRNLTGLKQIWLAPKATPQYYPLVHTSYWIEYQLWGLWAMGYHAVNVLLHAASTVLLWIILRRLRVPGAWLAAAVFGVHPVHVESVAWVTERKNVLSGLFYFASLLSFLWATNWRDKVLASPRMKWYVLSLLLFVGALLSKTVTCSLPAVLILMLWWKRGTFRELEWKMVGWLTPFFVVGALLAVVTVRMERKHVGAEGIEWSYSLVERCLIAGRSLWFYMAKLVWPQRLVFFYEHWDIDGGVWLQYLFPALFGVVLVGLWLMRSRIGRGPLAAMLIFAGTLVPALGFFNVYPHRYSFVADHFQYLGSVAFTTLVVAALASHQPTNRKVGMAIAGVMLALLGSKTLLRSPVYQDAKTLWLDTIAQNPSSWAAYNNLGLILMNEGAYSTAAPYFQRAVELKPDHAAAHAHLGMVYEKMNRLAEADRMHRRSIELNPNMPDLRLFAGNFYARQNRPKEAIDQYREALARNPRMAAAHLGAANVFMKLKDYAKAELFYTNVIQLDSHNAYAQMKLGEALLKQGRRDDAITRLQTARSVCTQPDLRRDIEVALARAKSTKTQSQNK